MKRTKLVKTMIVSLAIVSVGLLNSIKAHAEWKVDNTGWWYSEGSSWYTGWKLISGQWYYFEGDGYMKTGWFKDSDGKWYYLNEDGSMAHDTIIDGFAIGADGVWTDNIEKDNVSVKKIANINDEAAKISDVTGVNFKDVNKIIFYDGRGGMNKPVTVENKEKISEFMNYLNNYSIKKTENPLLTGWIHEAVFYNNDEEVMDIAFVNPLIINGEYFNITDGELTSDKISEYLNSVDPYYKK